MDLKKILSLLILMGAPFVSECRSLDTATTMTQLMSDFKSFKKQSYSYRMNALFPNGDRDSLNGIIFFDPDAKLYYNDCRAFTMIYDGHWFYRADHRNKSVMIADMTLKANKPVREQYESGLFLNNPTTSLFDSLIIKYGTIEKLVKEENVVKLKMSFTQLSPFKSIEIIFDFVNKRTVSIDLLMLKPLEQSPKGVQSMEIKYRLTDFNAVSDATAYNMTTFFTTERKKVQLKKYNNYKLFQKK